MNKLPPLAFEADKYIINKYWKNNKLQINDLDGSPFK